jgi:hypothetical protein
MEFFKHTEVDRNVEPEVFQAIGKLRSKPTDQAVVDGVVADLGVTLARLEKIKTPLPEEVALIVAIKTAVQILSVLPATKAESERAAQVLSDALAPASVSKVMPPEAIMVVKANLKSTFDVFAEKLDQINDSIVGPSSQVGIEQRVRNIEEFILSFKGLI